MKKIKVAFFAESLLEDFDGAVRTMYQIIDRIPSDQFEFKFFTGERPQYHPELNVVEIPTLRLPINHNYKMALSFLVKNRLEQELKSFNPDIIHIATPSSLGNFAVNYANQSGIPSISIYHTNFLSYIDYYFERWPSIISSARKIMVSILQSFYNKCDLIYVPTNEMNNELKNIGVFSSHMKIWKRGLEKNVFSPEKRNLDHIRSITGNSNPNILFASRLVWEKNLKTLAAIFNSSKFQGKKYNFLVAGDGYSKEKLQAEMKGAYFLGNLSHDDLSIVYASSDVFLFPSVSETYGNVVIEAMASGLPCVIANGGGPIEFIDNGINGFICKEDDPLDYLEKIDRIIDDHKLSSQFKEKSLSFSQGFCWEKLTNQYFADINHMVDYKHLKTA